MVGDIARLAAFDPALTRVAPVGSGKESGLTVTDQAGRSWTEVCTRRERHAGWTLEAAEALPFPLDRLSRSLRLEDTGGRVVLTYRLDYQVRWGALGRLRLSPAHLQARVNQTVDAMVHAVRAQQWRHASNVQSILSRKGADVVALAPTATVRDVAATLKEKRIGCLLVIDDDQRLVGLVSERDVAYGLSERGEGLLDQPVATIMSTDLVVCAPDSDMEFVMLCMTDRRVRHLPVMDGDKLVGIISIGDVVRQRIEALESQSQTMREYIEGREWHVLHPPGERIESTDLL